MVRNYRRHANSIRGIGGESIMGRWLEAARRIRPIYQSAMLDYGSEHPEQAVEVANIYPTFTYDGALIPYKTIIRWTDGKLYIAQYDTYDRQDTDPEHDTNGWFMLNYRDGIRVIPETMTTATMFMNNEQGYYQIDGVWHLYKSVIDNNSWTPVAYAAGWEEIINE